MVSQRELKPECNNYGAISMLTFSDHSLETLYLKVFSDVGNIATAWEILQRRWKYCNDFFALYRCNISNPSVPATIIRPLWNQFSVKRGPYIEHKENIPNFFLSNHGHPSLNQNFEGL